MSEEIAKRSEDITDEIWNQVNEFNREMVQDYLDNQTDLSLKTRPAYRSGLRVFFVYVKDHLNHKDFTQIKKKEFQKYLNWLTNRGLSDSAIKFKKSCVSAFCNYIMLMYEEEYPTFRNFTVGLKVVQTGYVHEKNPLTPEEYLMLCKELEKREAVWCWKPVRWARAARYSSLIWVRSHAPNNRSPRHLLPGDRPCHP